MTGKLLSIRRANAAVTALSDEALLAACGTGDLAALDALFDRFHVAVYRFLGRLPATDEHARDDLVQATFLEARRSANHFRGRSAVKTWILSIAANLARHHMRDEQRRRDKHARYAEGLTSVPERPDEQVERSQLFHEIESALAALPAEQQIAFILCDIEEVRGVDLARAAGVPQGTIWRRLHVARKAVRAAIEKATR